MSIISQSITLPLPPAVTQCRKWIVLHAAVYSAINVCPAAYAAEPAVTVAHSYEPTPGLPGFTTWTLTAHSERPIMSFNFVGHFGGDNPLADEGFFGPLHQVHPFGEPTVYQDLNPVFALVGADVKQDSQFLAVTTGNIDTSTIFQEDSATVLQGVLGRLNPPLGTTVPFVQLVIPPGGRVTYRGDITDIDLRATTVTGELIAPPVPEPAGIVLVGCALLVTGSVRHCGGMRRQH